MKKSLLLILLSLASTCVVGCGEGGSEEEPVKPEPDPTEITGIEIVGNLEKTTYDYEDDWDLTGLSVNAIQRNKKRVALEASKYTLTKNVSAPKKMTNVFSVSVKYNPKKTITATRSFNNIYVKDEVYDEKAEVKAYYNDCNLELTGNKLLNELHKHSFSKHTYFVKYGETNLYLRKGKDFDSPDLIPGKHNTEYFYTGKESNYSSGTREHVWPCADSSGLWVHDSRYKDEGHYVDDANYFGGGSDLYHIRPSDSKINTARGDAAFIDFDDPEGKVYKPVIPMSDGGTYSLKCYKQGLIKAPVEYADFVEVDDKFKGDVARIIAYLYMHFHTNTNTPSDKKNMTGDLHLTDVLGYGTEERCIEVLKKWNASDKPSDVEKHRNHVVQQIQGNRNPFVDDYTLLDKMFE